MSEFCLQCSEELFGPGTGDFAGLLTEAESGQGFGVHVLCEGCGAAWVDHEGRCKSDYCLRRHGEKKDG